MEEAADQQWAACRQRQLPLSAILIDLDGFKKINDSFGHHMGDQTLIAVAQCLQGHVRGNDVLARLGGDEFVILLPETRHEQAWEIAERLRKALEVLAVNGQDQQIEIRASFGLAQAQEAHFNWGQLLRYCDKALYEAKGSGGNGIRLDSSDLAYAQ